MDYYKNDDDHANNLNTSYCLFSTTSTSRPSTPSATATDASVAAGSRHYRARLILENHLYDELLSRYKLAITRLREFSREATALQEENEWLRLANEDLTRRLNEVLSVSEQPCVGPVTGGWSTSTSGDQQNNVFGSSNSSTRSVIDDDDEEVEEEDERVVLPKSISVRSSGFFKLVNLPTTVMNQSRSPSQHGNGTVSFNMI